MVRPAVLGLPALVAVLILHAHLDGGSWPCQHLLSCGRPSLLWPGLSALAPVEPSLRPAPVAKSQPGYYRMMLGDFEVTALSDGTVDLQIAQLLTNTTPARVARALVASVPAGPRRDLGQRLSDQHRVEARHGRCRFRQSVRPDSRQAGGEPARGGLPAGAGRRDLHHPHARGSRGRPDCRRQGGFSNAIVRADQREADYWLSPKNLAAAPADAKSFFEGAMASMRPYIDAGRFRAFDGDTELGPGRARAGGARSHAGARDVRRREPRPEARALGRPDACGCGAVSRAVGDDPVRHRFEGSSSTAQEGLRRCGQTGAVGRRLASALSGVGPSASATAAVTTGSRRTTACRAEANNGKSNPSSLEETCAAYVLAMLLRRARVLA